MTRYNPKTDQHVAPPHACPKCKGRSTLTLWIPPRGVDNNIRQFRCVKCKHEFYKIITNDRVFAALTTRQATMKLAQDKAEQDAKTPPLSLPGMAPATSQRSRRHAPPGSAPG